MKKVLLAGTALFGVVALSTAASAELKLDLGGYFRGYAAYTDEDVSAAGAKDFDFRRDTEIHVTGETTLDNGLTVGFHTEQQLGNNGFTPAGIPSTASTVTDEVYGYLSGNWGRVNFGSEDGAAYLLQVAAPSADSNVDGLRNYIQNLSSGTGQLDYDNADFRNTDRITYLTPKFSGFQAGISYAPQNGQDGAFGGVAAPAASTFEDLWEASARWDGEFSGFGISFGAGYATASGNAPGVVDPDSWDAGLNIAFNAFSIGAAYLDQSDAFGVAGADVTTWVFGGAWDNGPFHAGVSYLDQENDLAGVADADRITVGGGYTFGPGMTFRGAVAFGSTDAIAGAGDSDFTQVTLGTDIQF